MFAVIKSGGKQHRVPKFKKGAIKMINFIMEKFEEMQIFTGENYDAEAGLAFSYIEDGEEEPVVLYFADGMREEYKSLFYY